MGIKSNKLILIIIHKENDKQKVINLFIFLSSILKKIIIVPIIVDIPAIVDIIKELIIDIISPNLILCNQLIKRTLG